MNGVLEISDVSVSMEALQPVLEQQLAEHFGSACTINRLTRRPSEYHSSYPIEELNVVLANGTSLDLIFKNLSESALLPGARTAKPEIVRNPHREIETYERVLSRAHLGTPLFYGAKVDDHSREYWLFIEDVPGLELYQIGELSSWQEAARWLARMHSYFGNQVSELENNSHLLGRDEDFYWIWMRRAEQFVRSDSSNARTEIQRLLSGFERAVDRITRLPRTLIHGEFYASNVLVEQTSNGVRVCPVDWEMAGTGPGLMDLAALVSGKWSNDDRISIANVYYEVMDSEGWHPTFAEFRDALDCCRLILAVQWLGWSPAWVPPAEHSHDWLGEAGRLSEKLAGN